MEKLYLVLVGLPARGKSIVGLRLQEGLEADGIRAAIFNNGALRRARLGEESSSPSFYDPDNREGRAKREDIALANMRLARDYLAAGGQVAILDATNASMARREALEKELNDAPIFYVECINDDKDLLSASIDRKARLPEFAQLSHAEAVANFTERINYYESIYAPLERETSFVRINTLYNRILREKLDAKIPYYVTIRDILVSDWVRNLYLVRHGESEYNVHGRIGGDAPLTEQGRLQAQALARHFMDMPVPYIFTSTRLRSFLTAAPLHESQPNSVVVPLNEFDEINAGICDSMRYEDIRKSMPEEYAARARDKYTYVYPKGEGYITLKERVDRGFRKALFLSGAMPGIMIIGHQAINRMILSLFLYRRKSDVPYIYVPQDQYFHIVATHRKKLFELVRFM